MRQEDTAEAINQPPAFGGVNLFDSDPLLNASASGFPDAVREGLAASGAFWGSHDARELARLAERHPPELERYDAQGRRIDELVFHPAYHALMRRSVLAGLHCSPWERGEAEAGLRHRARALRLFMATQTEAGHLGAMTSTHAAMATLAGAAEPAPEWAARILSRDYDRSTRPATAKRGVTIGLAFAERGAGSDLAAVATRAEAAGDGGFALTGGKWFLGAPASDAFVVLARAEAGPTAFLVPRFRPDGTPNAIRLERLKAKLGNRSSATAEAVLDGALGWALGEPGGGLERIRPALALTWLDCAVVSAGLMRAGFAEAVHALRHRSAGGRRLVDQPLAIRVLSDMALDLAAALALSVRLAEAFDRAEEQPAEAAYARLMAPAVRYWVTKTAPAFLAEAMECLGGNGYVEESVLPRLYREAPFNAIWNGPGDVMAREVTGACADGETLRAVLETLRSELGPGSKAAIDVLAAAASVSLADEGSARILTEQLALTAAAAALRRDFPAAFADAFIETRLGRPWRATYGMIDGRFDSRTLVDYVAPAAA